jgi:hypothetical protein
MRQGTKRVIKNNAFVIYEPVFNFLVVIIGTNKLYMDRKIKNNIASICKLCNPNFILGLRDRIINKTPNTRKKEKYFISNIKFVGSNIIIKLKNSIVTNI